MPILCQAFQVKLVADPPTASNQLITQRWAVRCPFILWKVAGDKPLPPFLPSLNYCPPFAPCLPFVEEPLLVALSPRRGHLLPGSDVSI